ncbi:MAG: T9SS type A sorting domain-containing protein, partial [Chitinophagaceae bacterium]|nr:T9SS type A sorting domain-containing protein [Chitinophagaceae bacterium]
AQSLYNNASMRFTARNARFLFNEMENLANSENCSSECSNPYSIGGKTTLCASETYSVPGLQRGATVTWAASPLGIVNLSCTNCTSTTLTKISNGIVTLTATLNGACGGGTIPFQKKIQAGTPVVTWPEVVYPITSNGCLPMGFNVSYQSFINPQMPNGSLVWGYYEGATGGNLTIVNSGVGSGTYQPIRIQNSQQYNRIYVAGENECGVGTPAIKVFEFSSNCNGGSDVEYRAIRIPEEIGNQKFSSVSIFPNPTSNKLSIALPNNLIGGQLRILSLQGKVMRIEKVASNNFTFDLANFAAGVYIVEIINKGNSFKQKIVITR